MTDFLKRQLHILILVIVILVFSKIMHGHKFQETNRGVFLLMCYKMTYQKRGFKKFLKGIVRTEKYQNQQVDRKSFHPPKLPRLRIECNFLRV